MSDTETISQAYKSDASLKNYLKLRRKFPDIQIEVAVNGGFDSILSMRSEFEPYNITVEDMMHVLDANQKVISKISLLLIEHLIKIDELTKKGETQLTTRKKTIPLKLVDWMIAFTLDSLSWTNSMEMNRDLIVLINARLVGENPHYSNFIQSKDNREKAVWIGAQLLARGNGLSIRKIAKIIGVSPSTLSRSFAEGEFQTECEKLSTNFNVDGTIKSLQEK